MSVATLAANTHMYFSWNCQYYMLEHFIQNLWCEYFSRISLFHNQTIALFN